MVITNTRYKHDRVAPEQTQVVRNMVRMCIEHLAHPKYELGIECVDIAHLMLNTVVFTKPRSVSSGSARGISINTTSWQNSNTMHVHVEYAAFKHDPVIGQRFVLCVTHDLLMCVSHEVAHYVQRRVCPRVARFSRRPDASLKPHGSTFRDVYRMLRRDLINPMLDADIPNYKAFENG